MSAAADAAAAAAASQAGGAPDGGAGQPVPATPAPRAAPLPHDDEPAGAADLERRFGGLRRLYGDAGYSRLRSASIAVVGLGGVGSWAVEALARSGVARLVLFDLDHVAESNINRQVQALGSTLGRHKGLALRDRVGDIHPGCEVVVVDEFVSADNWPGLLPQRLPALAADGARSGGLSADAGVDVLIDACDQVRAKQALAAWSLRTRVPLVCVGAAGGKRAPHRVEIEDLADATHDPLLASLRQRLRKDGVVSRQGGIGVRCVFSRESVANPAQGRAGAQALAPHAAARAGAVDGTLNCAGYGSCVTVTATFGMVAAGEAIAQLLARAVPAARPSGDIM